MRYDEFRSEIQDALREVGLLAGGMDTPIETIDVVRMEQRWKLYHPLPSHGAEPFHICAEVAFNWSPIDAARSYTCEEDLLMELLGRKRSTTRTAQRFIRVDLDLSANLPYGSKTTIPEPQVLGPWADSIGRRLDEMLTETKERQGRLIAVLGGREEVQVEARCDVDGRLYLKAVSVGGFRFLRLPRVWDDPDRRTTEKDSGEDLARLALRFKNAADEWTQSVAEFARWIRYAPPPADARRVEPFFDDGEEEDGGPETIH
ncbi:MAG: hypothetical protein AB1714_29425 [Acidobacteriota bacterium]